MRTDAYGRPILESKQLSGGTIVGIMLAVVITLILLLINVRFNGSPGDGTWTGQVVGVKHVGILHKTDEVELIKGGLTGGTGSTAGRVFDATISNTNVLEQIKAVKPQSEITVKYHVDFVYLLWNSESGGIFITDVQSN